MPSRRHKGEYPSTPTLVGLLKVVEELFKPLMDKLTTIEITQSEIMALIRRGSTTKLLSPKEAALTLGISERSVRRRIKEGSLPKVKIGKLIRVDLSRLPHEDGEGES